LNVLKDDFELSAAKLDISITGGVTDLIVQSVSRLFKKQILKFIIKEATKVIQTTLPNTINADIAKYSLINADSLQLDLSLTRPPNVTNDNMLSLFVKAGLTNTNPHVNRTDLEEIKFPNFEIGNISRQDLMIHVPVEFVNQGAQALAGGVNFTNLML
jgi:hypothetical protein